MNWSIVLSTFGLIFLAEIGDKTQLATISLVARTGEPTAVFVGAASALAAVTFLGVVGGGALVRWLPAGLLDRAAGVAFLAVGAWMLLHHD